MQLHSETRRWVPSVSNAFYKMTERAIAIGEAFTLNRVYLDDGTRNRSLRPIAFIGEVGQIYNPLNHFVQRMTVRTNIPSFTETWSKSAAAALLGLTTIFVKDKKAPFTLESISAEPVMRSEPFVYWADQSLTGVELTRWVHFIGRVWMDEKGSRYKASIKVVGYEVTDKSSARVKPTYWDPIFGSRIIVGGKNILLETLAH